MPVAQTTPDPATARLVSAHFADLAAWAKIRSALPLERAEAEWEDRTQAEAAVLLSDLPDPLPAANGVG